MGSINDRIIHTALASRNCDPGPDDDKKRSGVSYFSSTHVSVSAGDKVDRTMERDKHRGSRGGEALDLDGTLLQRGGVAVYTPMYTCCYCIMAKDKTHCIRLRAATGSANHD